MAMYNMEQELIQSWWQEVVASEPETVLLISFWPMQRSHGT